MNNNTQTHTSNWNSDLSIWLSLDPLSDKYPSMSAFMYCAGNPLKFIDPDGRKIDPTSDGSAVNKFNQVYIEIVSLVQKIDNKNYKKMDKSNKSFYDGYLNIAAKSKYNIQCGVFDVPNNTIYVYSSRTIHKKLLFNPNIPLYDYIKIK